MQFYYGDQNYLRVLDEVEFWKYQEAEHTVGVIVINHIIRESEYFIGIAQTILYKDK